MVEPDIETVQAGRPFSCNLGDQLLRSESHGLGLKHDRRAMRIICTDKMDFMPAHPLEANPDIGLNVFHDVADMERAIGVGQGGGDKEAAGRRGHG